MADQRVDYLISDLDVLGDEIVEICIDDYCEIVEPEVILEKKGGKEQARTPQDTLQKILDRIPVLSGSGTVRVKYQKKNKDGSTEKVEVTVDLKGSTGKE